MSDPNQKQRTKCKTCKAPLAEPKSKYCSAKCQRKMKNNRRWHRFAAAVARPMQAEELAAAYGVTEDELKERVRASVASGRMAAWPRPGKPRYVGLVKPPEST